MVCLGVSNQVWVNGQAINMDDSFRLRIEAANERLAKKGMRVLGVAFRLLNQIPEDHPNRSGTELNVCRFVRHDRPAA